MEIPIYYTDRVSFNLFSEAYLRLQKDPPREYLGMSQIGFPCAKKLWLGIHGYKEELGATENAGRIKRIFEQGEIIEDKIIKELEAAGYQITNRQESFSDFDGQFKGHCDGIIHKVTSQPHILEIKSANKDNFEAFVKQGIGFKPEYYAQVICYMGYAEINRALFIVENKNNQDLYSERVHFVKDHFLRLKDRAKWIIEAETPLEMTPGKYCYFCTYNETVCIPNK
jgi:hypothetical protein